MIDLKLFLKEVKLIEKELNKSTNTTNTFAWTCALERKLHSLDNFLVDQKSFLYKEMVNQKIRDIEKLL